MFGIRFPKLGSESHSASFPCLLAFIEQSTLAFDEGPYSMMPRRTTLLLLCAAPLVTGFSTKMLPRRSRSGLKSSVQMEGEALVRTCRDSLGAVRVGRANVGRVRGVGGWAVVAL